MANRKKPYFAQNNVLTSTGHRSRYFDDLEDARQWLRENGGGTIKKRDADVVQDPFAGKIRVWGVIEQVEPE